MGGKKLLSYLKENQDKNVDEMIEELQKNISSKMLKMRTSRKTTKIKAENIEGDVLYFKSKYQCAQYFNVSPALIYLYTNRSDYPVQGYNTNIIETLPDGAELYNSKIVSE